MTEPAEATAWIDARLAALPEPQRAALQALRETIARTAPQAEQTIIVGSKYIRAPKASFGPKRLQARARFAASAKYRRSCSTEWSTESPNGSTTPKTTPISGCSAR